MILPCVGTQNFFGKELEMLALQKWQNVHKNAATDMKKTIFWSFHYNVLCKKSGQFKERRLTLE